MSTPLSPVAPRAAASTAPKVSLSALSAQAPTLARGSFVPSIVTEPRRSGKIIVLYAGDGMGKTSLVAGAPNALIVDLENKASQYRVPKIEGITEFDQLRDLFCWEGLAAYDFIAVDGHTRAEEMATKHVLKKVKHEKGHEVTTLAGYGFGKGIGHLYDHMVLWYTDMRNFCDRTGKNVVIVAHLAQITHDDPDSPGFAGWQPKSTCRSRDYDLATRLTGLADEVWCIGFNKEVQDGKAVGDGSRHFKTMPRPYLRAKTTCVPDMTQYPIGDNRIWKYITGEIPAGTQLG